MILVTGISGFIGKYLCAELLKKYSKDDLIFLTRNQIKDYNCIIVSDYLQCKDIENQYIKQISEVIHLGAFTPKCTKEANLPFENTSNIIFTQFLLTLLNNAPVRKFIYISTLDVYKNVDEIINESTVTEPQTLYGWSKLYSEKLIECWAKNRNVIHQILRVGHVYGIGEEKYRKLIPIIIENAILKNQIDVINDGSDLRSYIHVLDVVSAIVNSLTLDESIGFVNIVSGTSFSILEIVKKIISFADSKVNINFCKSDQLIRNLKFDNFKMQKYLHEEKVDLDEGLKNEYFHSKERLCQK